MKSLQSLLQGLPVQVKGSSDVQIRDITLDSRNVLAGALFVALQGVHQDGRHFVESALKAGAAAVLSERELPPLSVPTITATNALQVLSTLSMRFWDNPSHELRMVGITGTNGKTTTSYLIESIFAHAEWPTGVMGTINYRFGTTEVSAPNTTPFSSEIQRFLRTICNQGAKACVMEVSSHALALGRVEGVEYDVAVFTNLTQDHLDFHKTMEDYANAKTRLFEMISPDSTKPFPRHVVLNADDVSATLMAKASRVPTLRYGLQGSPDITVEDLQCDASASRFILCTPLGRRAVTIPLIGEYNVSNALAAAGVGISQGLSLDAISLGLASAGRVPGRMERYVSPSGVTVVVDYAHTEDALRKVMGALKKLKPSHLITVFGCGGDRDRAKRPLMGEAAAQVSDHVIVTSDNPRSEDPARIALDVEVGVRRVRSDRYEIVLDREAAIARALSLAKSGDIVLVAGKGHETYQILADRTIAFDDREVAQRLLAAHA